MIIIGFKAQTESCERIEAQQQQQQQKETAGRRRPPAAGAGPTASVTRSVDKRSAFILALASELTALKRSKTNQSSLSDKNGPWTKVSGRETNKQTSLCCFK